jgi:hypothetical protein
MAKTLTTASKLIAKPVLRDKLSSIFGAHFPYPTFLPKLVTSDFPSNNL